MTFSELGKAVSTTAEALKGNPSCLAAISLAAIFAVLTYFALQSEAERVHQRTMALLNGCFPTDVTK